MARQTKTLLRMKQTENKVKLGHTSIYNKLNPNSDEFDATFPPPIRVGKKAVRWIEEELDAWITSRPRTRDVAANDAVISSADNDGEEKANGLESDSSKIEAVEFKRTGKTASHKGVVNGEVRHGG